VRDAVLRNDLSVKRYEVFLFDLDGTLTDPKAGIVNSILYALDKLGIPETGPKYLEKFIGPPLLESFKKYYGFSDEKARQAVSYYREYFADKGIFENNIYEGIDDILTKLDELGCQLILATSKPTIYAERILEHFRLHQYFDLVVGSNMDLTRTSKVEVIEEVLDSIVLSSKDCCVMIGDREDDIRGAKSSGIDSVAVTYGYGSPGELHDVAPTYTVHTVSELNSLLLGLVKR
jgi:phosphoglycolate phosphatase